MASSEKIQRKEEGHVSGERHGKPFELHRWRGSKWSGQHPENFASTVQYKIFARTDDYDNDSSSGDSTTELAQESERFIHPPATAVG